MGSQKKGLKWISLSFFLGGGRRHLIPTINEDCRPLKFGIFDEDNIRVIGNTRDNF